jgi:dTDP-4-amino-4,6-dideoxygalactose transaminase
MMQTLVPFTDLKPHHEQLRDEIIEAIQEVIDTNAYAGGPFVTKFEQHFAEFCGRDFAVGAGNGTDALWLALRSLGVEPGDEVVTVPNTFFATAEAISNCGATPVFADIDEHTYTMDPDRIESAITDRTKAIIPVHLFGLMADMDPILQIAGQRGIPVIEDASHAPGAKYKGHLAGTMGHMGCFSFYPAKNLGALGEAGAVVTNDPDLDKRLRMYREHGQARKHYHAVIGRNCRMDGIQAAALIVKLRHLEWRNDLRRSHAQRYDDSLTGFPRVLTPTCPADRRHVYHIYAVRVPDRDSLVDAMSERGVACGIHYPVPIHLQDAYVELRYRPGDFPVAEKCSAEFLSLPMYPELSADQIDWVVESLIETIAEGALA